MKYSILMLSYNNLKLTKQCVESVIPYLSDSRELIIVDDGSNDGSDEYVKWISENTKSVVAHLNTNNRGASSSRNSAIKQAKGQYILFIDNDTQFTGDVCVEMSHILEENSAQIVGMCGVVVKNAYHDYIHIHNKYLQRVLDVCAVPSYCMMIDSNLVWNDSIFFDEKFDPFAGEDIEFCIHAKTKGYSVLASPHISLTHQEHGSGLVHDERYVNWMENHHIDIKIKWEGQYSPEDDIKLAETWKFIDQGHVDLSLHTEHVNFYDYNPQT